MAVIVWVLAGLPCLFGALCFCELACMYGKTGGLYIYLHEAYGNVVSFVCVWAQMMVITPLGLGVTALAVGNHIVAPFYDIESSSGMWLTKMVAVLTILLSTAINCVSTSFVGRSAIFFTIIQTVSVCLLVVLGMWQVAIGNTANYVTMFNNTDDFEIGSFGIALYNGLWGYEGWGKVAVVSEELENLDRDLWLSIVTGMPFVFLCYVLVNLAFMAALTRDEIANSSTVATTFVESILGKKVAILVPFAVAFSSIGSMNGQMFMPARLILSASREGQLPCFLSFIHKQRRTPIPAVLALLALSVIWILVPGIDMQSLMSIFSTTIWTQYFMAIFSLILMRVRKPHLKRPFKVWIINPVFTCLCALFLIVIPFLQKPRESAICFSILLTALPVFYIFIKKFDSLPWCLHTAIDKFNEFLRQKCNLVPCVYLGENDVTNDVIRETKL